MRPIFHVGRYFVAYSTIIHVHVPVSGAPEAQDHRSRVQLINYSWDSVRTRKLAQPFFLCIAVCVYSYTYLFIFFAAFVSVYAK